MIFRKPVYLGLTLLVVGSVANSVEQIKNCQRSQDCVDGQACVAYTSCQKKRVKRCLERTCHRQGVNCPGNISCQDKHCGEVGPCVKKSK
jgi:hypothetical protein